MSWRSSRNMIAKPLSSIGFLVILSVFTASVVPGAASDWPMWRFDAQRSAAGTGELPEDLSLTWSRQYDRRIQVWDDPLNHDMMPYDKVFEPIVVGQHVIVGFNDSDKVVAFDARSGGVAWRFFCDGPVRMPPASDKGRVFVTSDDGYIYCLSGETGQLQWKFQGAPADQKVLGNKRIVSMWPARGGAVIADDTVYFSSSIWPFLGTFFYALEAETGEVQWVNDGTGSIYIKQPHSAPSFGGVAPQGAMAVSGSNLVVPGGRSVPAVFDRQTGAFKYFHLNEGGKGTGGSLVMTNDDSFFVHTRGREVRQFNLDSGKKTEHRFNEPVLAGDVIYAYEKREVKKQEDDKQKDGDDKTEAKEQAGKKRYEHWIVARDANDKFAELWKIAADGSGDLIRAGSRLYAAGATEITVIELPAKDSQARVAYKIPVTGQVLRLVAGADKLIAVTLDGRIMAFGKQGGSNRIVAKAARPSASASAFAKADAILKQLETREGYALCFGADDGELLESLVARSQLHIAVVESDVEKVAKLRERWDDAGWYGKRLSIHQGDPLTYQAPPYIANLVLVGREVAKKYSKPNLAEAMYKSVRPYGGVLCYQRTPTVRASVFTELAESVPLLNAEVKADPRSVMLVRKGALPGSAPWTHLYGDIANSVKSKDSLVKLPLGILWFGGNSNTDVLPRHGHGPCEQVVGGRLFLEGMDRLTARDVYTGRLLWKRVFDDLGTFDIYYDDTYKDTPLDPAYNQVHLPGANLRGTNYVVTEDAIYLVIAKTCLVLDPVTGRTKKKIELPTMDDGTDSKAWGYLGVYEDVLLAGADFANFTKKYDDVKFKKEKKKGDAWSFDRYGSGGLIAMDRHSGEKLWELKATNCFLHNTIIAGGGRVYMVDKLPRTVESQLRRRGLANPDTYEMKVVDAKTGKPIWNTSTNIFGTWLGYSEEYDILIQAGSAAPDRAKEEVGKGVVAYNAANGKVRWHNKDMSYSGPCILLKDMIITNSQSYKRTSGVYNLLDGSPRLISNSLTGGARPWTYTRAYGCNTAVASENLLTFRSGAAGFYDLNAKSGTGNLGGFRAGCSSNLIVADGVLNAPDYTRTCSCGYQNQTSLALVHMPNVEMWTVDQFEVRIDEAIQRVGLNLGAPGDRRGPSGTMWLEYPFVGGGDTQPMYVVHDGENVKPYRRHASAVQESTLPWMSASGLQGLSQLKIRLAPPRPPAPSATVNLDHTYDIRLHFAEPDVEPGQRVFDVLVQGERVLENVDVAKEAGGKMRAVSHLIQDVKVESYLRIDFETVGENDHGPILSGVELIAKTNQQLARIGQSVPSVPSNSTRRDSGTKR